MYRQEEIIMIRNNKFSIVSTTVLFLLMLAVPSLTQAGPLMKSKAARQIRLRAKQFTPTKGEQPAIPPGLAISAYPAGKSGYYIVQFQGPILQDWKDQVSATGAEILHYIPDFAFKVRMKPVQARQVKQLESVAWIGFYHPAYKLSPNLKRNGTKIYTVRIERSADVGLARAAIAKSGAKVLAHKKNILKVAANPAQLEAVARVLDVAWVENFMKWEKHDEYAAGTILNSNTANDTGYDGSTQIIGIADTGLGGGTINSSHPHISTRVKSIYNWTGGTGGIVDWLLCWYEIIDDGSVDVEIGHGTHVALAALGAGGLSGEGRGTAPEAELIFQSVENFVNYYDPYDPPDDYWCEYDGYRDGYYLTGIPADIGDLFQQAYNDGARIHSNSWGSNAMGAYTVDSANLDDFIWRNRDMTITYSAGNSGRDADGDGVVDSDSIGSPSTAKNVITVGASENDRQDDYTCDQTNLTYTSHDSYQPGQTCSDMGGNQSLFLGTWGQRYGSTFPSDPIASDLTAGNAEQMAAWSSRGRTDDARIKPDVVAPGTWILSGYSSLYQEGYGDPLNPQTGSYQWDGWGMPSTEWYKYMGGTSMSSPLVAGGAAVVRDFYEKAHGHNASAALVKATLINSAYDLQDENNDGVNDNHFPIPNVHEGWGRVDLVNATDSSHQYVDETDALQTGGEFTYQFSVNSAIKPFKVTLVWSDYPSTAAAWKHLVNDLNLEVTPPVGDNYLGNRFDVIYGWSITGGLPDKQNNVENVYVQSPTVGTWTVTVKGFNVPNGPQPFALVVDGTLGEVDTPPNVSIVDPTEGQTISGAYRVLVTASDDGGVQTVELSINSAPYLDITSYFDGSYYYYDWSTPADNGSSYTLQARATDDIAQSNESEVVNVIVDSFNDHPVASFTYICTALTCDFDASSSNDPDGNIDSYQWDFGDGNTDDTVTTRHTYTGNGTYTVQVTVTDNDGATAKSSQEITVTAPGNNAPVASFTASTTSGPAPLLVTFTSTSSDPDGDSLTFTWVFGDGSNAGTGETVSHTYSNASTYTVVLTVDDGNGGADTASQEITVYAPANTIHIGDLKARSKSRRSGIWKATVTITVHNAGHNPVSGATVYGVFDDGLSVFQCNTGSKGTCKVAGWQWFLDCLTFTVFDISHPDLEYNPTIDRNHDANGDSDGTNISVCRP
jgi:PKD repeat protein